MYQLTVYRGGRKLAQGLSGVDITNSTALEQVVVRILREAKRREEPSECSVEVRTVRITVKTDEFVGTYYPGAA